MGLLDFFLKKASKAISNEITKSPKQKEIEKMEKNLGVKLDPNSYQVFTEAEYQKQLRKDIEFEEMMIDRLNDVAYEIVQRIWDYQDDYMSGRMLKGDFRRQLELGYEDLKTEVMSSSSTIDPNGLLSLADKIEIYEQNKKHLDYLKYTWLPKN
jgi:hypothetical protein